MRSKKINPLIFIFLMSIQPVMSYSAEGYGTMALSLIMGIVSIAIPAAITAYVIEWIQERAMRPEEQHVPVVVKERLKNYAGEVPHAVMNLINQLKNVKQYKEMNVSITKGIILYGDPGCGKTYLARVVAGEVNCPFFAINATSFSQCYVGKARITVESVFTNARKAAQKHSTKTAIIFIDEFDSIGSRDHNNPGFTNTEIINTLLKEMDGFSTTDEIHIVVIAATNNLDTLDSAIIRTGRFDQKVHIFPPNHNSRTKIMEMYLETHPHDATVSRDVLVELSEGMTPADIKEVFNLAGRYAVSIGKKHRDSACFAAAFVNIINSKKEQRIASYVQRKWCIENLIMKNNISDISVEGLLNCTKYMSLNNIENIFKLAHNFAQSKALSLSSDIIAVASCVIEDSIKKSDKLKKREIIQKIPLFDEVIMINNY